jgi:hypothetical protein
VCTGGLNEPLSIAHLEAQAKIKADKLACIAAAKEAKKAAKLAAKQKKDAERAAKKAAAQTKAKAQKLCNDQEKIKKAILKEARRLEKDRKDNEKATARAESQSRKVSQQDVVLAAMDTWLHPGGLGVAPAAGVLRKWLHVYQQKESAPGLTLWNRLDPTKYNAAKLKPVVETFWVTTPAFWSLAVLRSSNSSGISIPPLSQAY